MNDATKPFSPIKSGWRGNISGHIEATESHIEVSQVTLRLDRATAYALANLLSDQQLEHNPAIDPEQVKALANLGAALGRLVDHGAANNGGRAVIR